MQHRLSNQAELSIFCQSIRHNFPRSLVIKYINDETPQKTPQNDKLNLSPN